MSVRSYTAREAMDFGGRLAISRQRARMSQEQVAVCIGTDRQIVSRLECGERMPHSATLTRLCKALNVSADYLLGLREEP